MKELQKITLFLFLPALLASIFWKLFNYIFHSIPLSIGLTIGIFWAAMLLTGLYLWGDKKTKASMKEKLYPALNYFKVICLGIFCIGALLIFITLAIDYLSSPPQPPVNTPQNLATG